MEKHRGDTRVVLNNAPKFYAALGFGYPAVRYNRKLKNFGNFRLDFTMFIFTLFLFHFSPSNPICHVIIYYIPGTSKETVTACIPPSQLASFRSVSDRMEASFDRLKTRVNECRTANIRAQSDIHRIISEVFRLDELSWGTIAMVIFQMLFGCINIFAWRRRPRLLLTLRYNITLKK